MKVKDHRPIIIKSIKEALSKKEEKKARVLVSKILDLSKQLDNLTRDFRELAGYEDLNVDYAEFATESIYNRGTVNGWIDHLRETRERWAIEDLEAMRQAANGQ